MADIDTKYKEKLRQTILTDAGRQVFLSVGNGVGTLVYTRATLSSKKPVDTNGTALDNEAVRKITSLPDDLKEGQLQLTPVTDNHFDVISDFSNKNQAQDISFSCIGWYARIDTTDSTGKKTQGDEVLIAITFTNDDHETLAAGSPDGLSTDVISAELDMTISDAANIDMTVNEIGYVTRAELNVWQTKVEDEIDKELDAKIKTVTDLANTKASQSNVNSLVQDAKNTATSRADNLQSQITRIDGTTEIGAATDVNTLTGDPKSLRVYKLSNSDNKNTPYWCSDKRGDLVVINYDGNAKTQLWFGVGMGNSQSAGIRYWEGNNFSSWHKLAEDTDIDNLQSQLNGLQGKQTANAPDFNALTTTGTYCVTNVIQGKNYPTGTWGTLTVFSGENHRIEQVYYPDDNDMPFYRMKDEDTWRSWVQLSSKSDISNLQNQINTKLDASTFNSRVNTASTTYRMLDNTSDWNTIFGVPNGNNVLSSLRVNGTAPGPLLNNFSAGVGFGGADTKGVLTVAYSDHQARISGGNGSAPVWSEDVAWKSDVNNLQNQVNDLINQINYIKQNYLQGKRFPASQEAQAQAWENANPNGIAMIEK